MKQIAGKITDEERASTYLPLLAEYLRVVVADRPPMKFNMGTWGSHIEIGCEKEYCNTSGCAVGHATTLFKEDGLHLRRYGDDYGVITPCFTDGEGDTHHNYNAASLFFGLDSDAAEFLFSPDEYYNGDHASPITVANRIERFLRSAPFAQEAVEINA